ncbi:Hypothetical predicted protein [Paramuricea clavata]|uniref:Uncharacterized protein n=1 Tax=Paramuricea clavata TaxID=317549 RepID=A0A6S7J5F5_PARCT|nr:Hypothetical predicted protein [Paramuricea clavata]
MFELEKVFDDFCVINEEYELIVSDEKYAEHRVVNDEDIRTYRDNVKRCYEEARSVFVSVKTTIEQKARQQSAGPVKVALKNDICRIHELITVVDESFKLDNVNMAALQPDKSDLQSILNIICANMAKLGSIETQEDVNLIQEEVDAIIRAVYNCIRLKICRLRLASINFSDIKGADLRIDSDAVCEEEIIASLDLSFTNNEDIYAPQLRSKYTQKSDLAETHK